MFVSVMMKDDRSLHMADLGSDPRLGNANAHLVLLAANHLSSPAPCSFATRLASPHPANADPHLLFYNNLAHHLDLPDMEGHDGRKRLKTASGAPIKVSAASKLQAYQPPAAVIGAPTRGYVAFHSFSPSFPLFVEL